ncbi:MAG: aminoglycoside phosphotransferase family protein [Bacteroidota bacterium]
MALPEIPLSGGEMTASVVRIGDRVHRSPAANAAFTQAVLQYLEAQAFPFSPRYLGQDAKGREVLSFLPGDVPRAIPLNFPQMKACIRILRSFHDLMAKSPLRGEMETVCHHDFAPWNVIVDQKTITGLIDFDTALPGARVEDVGYFLWTFLDLGDPYLDDQEQLERVEELLSFYGPLDRKALIPALQQRQNDILQYRKDLAISAPSPEQRAAAQQRCEEIKMSMQWVATHL